jgi:hypothetical protein
MTPRSTSFPQHRRCGINLKSSVIIVVVIAPYLYLADRVM